MRKVIYCSVILLLLLLIDNYSFAATPKIYAVVVGVAKYKDASIPNLKYSEKDAQAFYDFLRSPYSGAIPEDNIALLLGANATRSNIIKEVVDIFDRSTKDDMIIFYFSGHGKGDASDNSGYLLGYDTENDNEAATALSMDELKNKIDKRQAKLKVSYVDACHAGYFKGSGAKGTMEENNAIIVGAMMESIAKADDGNVAFLSSSSQQQSLEDDKLGNGVFTYYLLKGLKGEADKEQKDADGYNDGLVTVGEMATYLSDKIPAATKYKQKPMVNGTYDEGFPLSVLRSNVVIANEIGKRPEKKVIPKLKLATAAEKPEDKKLSPGQTYDNGACYGVCTFINNSKFNLNLYTIKSPWSPIASSVQVVSGKSSQALRIRLTAGADPKKASDCNDFFRDCAFYFSINDSGVQKYATFNTAIEAGKGQYFIIDEGTLTFTTNQPTIN